MRRISVVVGTALLFSSTVVRKENWELAAYPVENHGFTEATSWADEHRRILKLFEGNLRLKAGKVTH
jgi:dipeptidyl aminopeptidase/acylaminoacyl peptidase